ncbi:MAG: hypothetical protein IT338_14395 [Thermomicrobiales bacterium]|nr:hypothetical protein [Thermomicrobiales bacterium]
MSAARAAGPSRTPGSISSKHAPALDLPARFMALAMLLLAALALAAPWTMPLLLGSFYDPRLLAFVHLNTLGVIAAVILGASYQLVPVVLQTPLSSVKLGRLSFWAFLGGLIALPIGLLRGWLPALIAGGTLLAIAFLLYIGIVAATLRRAPHRDVVAWHMIVALVGLLGGVTYGVILAINKGTGILGEHTLANLAAHATIMLGGWVAVFLAGVAYRLVGMFTLAEEAFWEPAAWAELVLTAGGAWVLSTNLHLGGPRALSLAGALALLAGLALFAGQLAHLYRRRKRRGLDVHIPFALTAAAAGVLAAALLALGFARQEPLTSPLWIVAGWLAIAGFAETAIQGFFYKIATFLVWLQRYAPLAGRQRVPKLEELYGRRLALAGWALWSLGVALAAIAAGIGALWLSYAAGLLVAAGLVAFLVNVARIANHWRAPGARNAGQRAGIQHKESLA